MRRLVTSAFLLIFLLLKSAQAQPEVHHYSIGGDVREPQTYQWPGDQTVHLRDLVSRAGVETSAGYALVLRGQKLQLASVERIDPSGSNRGSVLESGDIVIFKSPSAAQFPVKSNALVLYRDVPDVLPFDGPAYPMHALLDRLGLSTLPGVFVTRTVQGNPVTLSLERKSAIRHGDIIHLAKSVTRTELRAEDLPLSYSTPPVGSSTSPQTEEASDSETGFPYFEATDNTANSQPMLLIPGGFDQDSVDSGPAQYSNDANELNTKTVSQSSGDAQMELRTADPIATAETERINSSVSRADVTPVLTASLQTETSANAPSGESQTLQPASETANADATFIWNMVFGAGLLFATGLIAVGWLKAQQERKMEGQMDESLRRTISAPASDPVVEPVTDSQAEHRQDSAVSDDTQPVTDDCPVLSAGLESPLPEQTAAEPTPLDTVIADTAETPVFGAEWLTDKAVEVVPDTENDIGTVVQKEDSPLASDTAVESDAELTKGEENSGSAQESWSDLEDLIQNRLPIELTKLQLPLRVNLFGRPAGPRRLRIDAAHTQIAAPHMMKKTRGSKKSKPAAATQANADSGGSSGLNETVTDISRLDKALNYLEEQSGS